ncbi:MULTISPECIES: beta-glucoside kinase BglK [Enterobacteriaceae]|uniref:Beta-glucoside kinase n=2 Tax=Kluyvera genomosp. 2 TaxID=2774054 RepID=A0A2T2Y7L6_9ENTR|nr:MULTISPECIES: beta-glucoside kinase BglK [Enterobacteriaceae]HAT3916756.1 ROK family protein [Kluyvera ascorbata]PSR48532.1 beta-glucoside kinase [Kluyvera genomosp. 2]BBQ82814.1 beta-glucoside kinase [Klebsiella sp. WP3-W18-ESBL-02]BBR19849.1 beta-glucoside kinase [Klebsiella sp. WP3-S18-ESBL-05]BBR59925.1 beta-glucoside kinase [Klebsiella sp. WP4-W18-ESBL-05]
MNIAAFDIGGTALKMGVVTASGELLKKGKQPISNSDGEQILAAMEGWIAAHPECEGIAISAPGYVNPHTGYIEMGGAIRRFDRFAIKDWLEERSGLPVAIENDANCVLLAERWKGKGAELSDFLVMTIGTGIGGAIFCNNQLVHGARFRAGEFGYMQTSRPGARDVRRYSMNENCTLRVLRHRYAQHLGLALEAVTGEDIFDRFDAGDAVCQRLVAEFFNDLGTGLYNLVNLFDPQTILIGGGIVERPGFLALMREHLAWFGIADNIDTVSHGNDAGLIGAVYHFNQQHSQRQLTD